MCIQNFLMEKYATIERNGHDRERRRVELEMCSIHSANNIHVNFKFMHKSVYIRKDSQITQGEEGSFWNNLSTDRYACTGWFLSVQ